MQQPTTTPSRDDGVTIACPVCTRPFIRVGRQRVCSAACRQAAYRRRQQAQVPPMVLPPGRSRRAGTVYECPACEARYLGEQRCSDCGVFCRRIGLGGRCPHCEEPVAVTELADGPGGRG